jgi:hypothetical protein
LNTTMIYARAYDQTVEADYYAAMSRVEQRLALVEEPEEEMGTPVGKDERAELLKLADQLSEPELSKEVRLELVLLMRALLNGKTDSHSVERESLPRIRILDHPPPTHTIVDAIIV